MFSLSHSGPISKFFRIVLWLPTGLAPVRAWFGNYLHVPSPTCSSLFFTFSLCRLAEHPRSGFGFGQSVIHQGDPCPKSTPGSTAGGSRAPSGTRWESQCLPENQVPLGARDLPRR